MDAAACAKILWMISGCFSGDSDELIKIRRALAEAIFNTDGKGFPKPVDPPAKVLDSKEWNGCKNAALEVADSKQSSDDSRKNQIKFILLAPNGLEDKPDIKSPDLNIAWPVTSDVAYQAGPVFDGFNRKIHLLGYYIIDQAQALSDPGFGSEGLYPVKLRNSLPPKISPAQHQESKGKPFIASLFFALAIAIGIISMAWIAHITQSIRMNANLILSKTTNEIDSNTKKIKSIVLGDENKTLLQPELNKIDEIDKSIQDIKNKCPKEKCSKEDKESFDKEIKELEEQKKNIEDKHLMRFENDRQCIEKISEQLKKDSPTIQNHKQCTDALFAAEFAAENVVKYNSGIIKYSLNDSRLSLMVPFVLSQIAILLFVFAAGFAIKGGPLGVFVNTRNRMSLSSVQQILWTILVVSGITILAIFNIALSANYTDTAKVVYFPSLGFELWAALGLTTGLSPYISKRITSKKNNLGDENFENLEVRQDKNDVTGQLVSNQVAKWTDIFTDEKQENSNTVDISRLQHLVITGLLWGGYFILLAEYVSNINATVIFYSLLKEQSVFTMMPPVDETFIGLMALSHAGYLGFKALPPKTNS